MASEKSPSQKQPEAEGMPIALTYTNWRGETASRPILPTGRLIWGSNERHPEPQWLIEAWDYGRGQTGMFALAGFGQAATSLNPKTCRICATPLDQPGRPWTADCGGDCCACMVDLWDQDCIASMVGLGTPVPKPPDPRPGLEKAAGELTQIPAMHISFGHGLVGVDWGEFYDVPAVFIQPRDDCGIIGDHTPDRFDHLNAMVPGSTVLTFANRESAQVLIDAINKTIPTASLDLEQALAAIAAERGRVE